MSETAGPPGGGAAVRPSSALRCRRSCAARFGVPPLVTLGVAVVLAWRSRDRDRGRAEEPGIGQGPRSSTEQPPVFNLLYPPDLMHQARGRSPGELMRIEGHRGKLSVEIVVRPLRLPPYHGDVTHGQLPVYADRFADAQSKTLPGFVLTSEGRVRVNNAVGYEIAFQSVRPQSRVYGSDVLLVPDDPAVGKGLVTLSLRQSKSGGGAYTKAERRLVYQSKKAYRSFRYGTDRG